MHNVATNRPPLRDPWLQRLRILLEAMPAVIDVSIGEEEGSWSVRVEYDYGDSFLYIALDDVRNMMRLVHDAYHRSTERSRVWELTWFDLNDWHEDGGVAPFSWLEVDGIDPSVLGKSIQWHEREARRVEARAERPEQSETEEDLAEWGVGPLVGDGSPL